MSKVVEAAVAALDEKAKGFDGTAKFVIEGEGSVYIDADGARAADDEAEVTLTASRETFEGLLSGDVNPTTAFMTGKLRVDGSMGMAMKLGALLS
ncbi:MULTISPECIES: SCP2 sterol-binding domain-containing protein [Paracoccus]|jgi:putative sterol carrier protein|uniref:Sterol-binding domain protein n=1 Tax=Paracoccus denitrificans (strain Pd 1222) TaxID=318586 RepID=A1B333_PARDP|nr:MULTISPECIES: SCP2 sterol-binding domain-containing protein [Paracoccus]ABL69927.1 Sterol-binding domain protein [Paracoccus denitrificans PD1222]MBB4627007.1 putative sterol carrier protein [Paracoccus denitrificans]MCU7428393.1 SCP2 sterol-binding domain-containing protein [Paracoccus denitrificans]MDK8871559.1 SCP2 sterol-binding domain-containing protein [Paracoccus sp. SSJ]QAR25315.1 SCP2 sterol-binding domain-containing protein [Paracoccus denitrificans]